METKTGFDIGRKIMDMRPLTKALDEGNRKWVSVESMLSEIKTIKELVNKHRLEHAGLGWLEARLNGIIIDLEKKE